MDIRIIEKQCNKIAVVENDAIVIANTQDALDLMATLRYEHNCERVIVPKACIVEDFFDLKTGIAGEILQKYTNYQVKIAIIGNFSTYTSKALRDFIRESNKGTSTFFLPDEATAINALTQN